MRSSHCVIADCIDKRLAAMAIFELDREKLDLLHLLGGGIDRRLGRRTGHTLRTAGRGLLSLGLPRSGSAWTPIGALL